MTNIFVKSEFAPLKRVVMAQSEFAFPANFHYRPFFNRGLPSIPT